MAVLQRMQADKRMAVSKPPPITLSRPICCLVILLLLTGCSAGPTPTPAPARLRVTGSTSMAPALNELAAAFQAQNPNVLVEVQGGGSAVGWDDLRSGRAEVAALSWWDESQPPDKGFRLVPVAKDGIAIIVHPSNTITNITTLQLRSLFGGEVLNWTELGGGSGEPAIISREDGSGTRAAFEARIMGGQRVTLNALVMPTTRAMADYVATHRLAVGYVSLDSAGAGVRLVPVEGLSPLPETVSSGAYYLTRVLYLGTHDPPSGAAQSFIDFVEGPAGQLIWAKHHARVR